MTKVVKRESLTRAAIAKRPIVMLAEELVPESVLTRPAPGSPPVYRRGYDELAYKMCLMGATNASLASLFGVNDAALEKWMHRHPSFKEAVKAGKDAADAEIANSLFHRARGYSHKTIKVMLVEGKPHQEEIIENFPPDTNAAKFWLMNRQPDKWREKMEVDNTHRVVLTEDQINERLLKLLPK